MLSILFSLHQCIVPKLHCKISQVSRHFILLDSHFYSSRILVALFWLSLSCRCLLDGLFFLSRSHVWIINHILPPHKVLELLLFPLIVLIWWPQNLFSLAIFFPFISVVVSGVGEAPTYFVVSFTSSASTSTSSLVSSTSSGVVFIAFLVAFAGMGVRFTHPLLYPLLFSFFYFTAFETTLSLQMLDFFDKMLKFKIVDVNGCKALMVKLTSLRKLYYSYSCYF